MDERIEIWNVLHDGDITAISESEGNLTLFVNIPYLRRRLQPAGDSFVLRLTEIKQCEFFNFDETTGHHLRQELEIGTPEIIKTESESIPVIIETSMGRLILNFERIHFSLDTGQKIDYQTILQACEEYWNEWQAKADGRTSS